MSLLWCEGAKIGGGRQAPEAGRLGCFRVLRKLLWIADYDSPRSIPIPIVIPIFSGNAAQDGGPNG
jgi:hypothetical protein